MSKQVEAIVRKFLKDIDALGYDAIIIKSGKINTSTLRKKGAK